MWPDYAKNATVVILSSSPQLLCMFTSKALCFFFFFFSACLSDRSFPNPENMSDDPPFQVQLSTKVCISIPAAAEAVATAWQEACVLNSNDSLEIASVQ